MDVSIFELRIVQEILGKRASASGREYRPARLSINPEAQARHDWKAKNLSMVRSVFGDSAAIRIALAPRDFHGFSLIKYWKCVKIRP